MADKVRQRGTGNKSKSRIQTRSDHDAPDKITRAVTFHLDIWLTLALVNWVFDFGRPFAAWYVPLEWTPLSMPSVGDYFHMAYNVIVPFCLLKLQERSPHKMSASISYLSLITFVMGASIHLVGDSVNHRLTHVGYQQHLSVRDNPIMQQLKPPGLVALFELLYVYDEEIGHLMWYIPFFLTLFIYFIGCFEKDKSQSRGTNVTWWLLLVFSAVYYWYLVTEGQIFSVFLLTLLCMWVTAVYRSSSGQRLDINGLFLLHSFNLTLLLTAVWVVYLWDDQVLRQKYPGWLYIPEPWSFYSLHYAAEL